MPTKPNRSVGIQLPASLANPLAKSSEVTHKPNEGKGTFKISRLKAGTGLNAETTWHFAMPPAVEAALQFSPNASVKGSITVPEVKPGLLNNSTMKYKNFLIPGGKPAVQAIGIQATTMQLTGTFIGTEGNSGKPSLNPIYENGSGGHPGYDQDNNAASKAVKFDREIVQAMQRVHIEIHTDVIYKFTGVILNFKYYMRKANRTYYVIDLLATSYK